MHAILLSIPQGVRVQAAKLNTHFEETCEWCLKRTIVKQWMTCTVQRNGFNQLAVKGRMPVRRGVTVRYMPNRVLVVGPMRFVMPDHREMAKLFMSGGSASVSMTVSGPCQPSPINTASDMPARAMPYLHCIQAASTSRTPCERGRGYQAGILMLSRKRRCESSSKDLKRSKCSWR